MPAVVEWPPRSLIAGAACEATIDPARRWCPECGGHLGQDGVVIDLLPGESFPVEWATTGDAAPIDAG